jgi:ABC-type phosphate/phosphonate transport system ATPase subunit
MLVNGLYYQENQIISWQRANMLSAGHATRASIAKALIALCRGQPWLLAGAVGP